MPRPSETPLRTGDCAIVLCADQKFFPPAYAVCLSLARQQPEKLDIFLLTEDGAHLDRVPNDIPFKIQTPDFVHRLPDTPEILKVLTPFGYLRLFLADMFEDYRRVLYLDCDIRIDSSIAPLTKLDMKGAVIAAADDAMSYLKGPSGSDRLWVDKCKALGLGLDKPYLNSGVLLIDCERWKRNRITGAAIECMIRHRAHITLWDQDVLNVIFRDEWLALSPRWNFPAMAFETKIENLIKPVVYHHLHHKPWQFGAASRRETSLFREAMRTTPYRGFAETPSRRQLKRLAERRLKETVQRATFFLPSSRVRLRARDPVHVEREVAGYIIKNIQASRFADVAQNISVIDVPSLSSLLSG